MVHAHYTLEVTQHSCWEPEGKEKGSWLQLCHSVVKKKLAESWQTWFLQQDYNNISSRNKAPFHQLGLGMKLFGKVLFPGGCGAGSRWQWKISQNPESYTALRMGPLLRRGGSSRPLLCDAPFLAMGPPSQDHLLT